MTDTVLGTDWSSWQDDNSTPQQINFPVMAAAGAKFGFCKVSQGDWIDQDVVYNWAASKGQLLRSGFHYLDWSTDGATQARRLWNTIRHDPGELKPMVDYEHRTGAPARANALEYLKECCEELTQLAGKRNILYTSPGFWMDFGSTDPYWAQYDLYIAHWGAITPIIPKPWTKAHFWQFTNKGDGKKFGAESLQIDLDYWMGTLDELYAYAGIAQNTTETRLTSLEKTVAYLEMWDDGIDARITSLADLHNAFVTGQAAKNAYLTQTVNELSGFVTKQEQHNSYSTQVVDDLAMQFAKAKTELETLKNIANGLTELIAKIQGWKDTPL